MMFVRGLGARLNVAVSVWNLDPAEPGRLLVVRPLEQVDRPVLEGTALKLCLGFLLPGCVSG